jgi:hypothetical protein
MFNDPKSAGHDDLPPCARCGSEIGDDDGPVLTLYSKTEAEIRALGREPTMDDLGELVEAYCAHCTREIEKAHEGHDQVVAELRDELDDWGAAG